MLIYKGKIEALEPNGIFVFGSNTEGRHGKGAALIARHLFGAIYGQATGLQGQSYAIVTKDLTKRSHPSITPNTIVEQIQDLYDYARANPDNQFFVAYSGFGFNLNGYSAKAMAELFSSYYPEGIPDNMVFEEHFYNLMLNSTIQ